MRAKQTMTDAGDNRIGRLKLMLAVVLVYRLSTELSRSGILTANPSATAMMPDPSTI